MAAVHTVFTERNNEKHDIKLGEQSEGFFGFWFFFRAHYRILQKETNSDITFVLEV